MQVLENNINHNVVDTESVVTTATSSFIEANTLDVSLEHLRTACTIPVFSKDNESTISHFQFIDQAHKIAKSLFPDFEVGEPDIRVSHVIKGRIPSAIGKPAKELEEHEKTLYYERCAFMIPISSEVDVNGNKLSLTLGGVRALNLENLYSKKSVEKFKLFIGYKNTVCTNLCISTDGFSNEIRITSVEELGNSMQQLCEQYDQVQHLETMKRMLSYSLTELEFAHLVGKLRMYPHHKNDQKSWRSFNLNDGQVNSVVRDYYSCPNFSRDDQGSISLWNLYNLLTEANKSSYIDTNINKNVNMYEFTNHLLKSLANQTENWFLPYLYS